MALLPRSLLAATATATATAISTVPPAPVARVEVVHDTYFGETLSDPYRWMENDKDPDWLPFLKGQNDHTRAVLDALARPRGAAQAHPATLRRNRRRPAACSAPAA